MYNANQFQKYIPLVHDGGSDDSSQYGVAPEHPS